MAVNYDRTRTNQRDITTAQYFVRHCPDTRRELYYIVMEEQRGNYDRKNYDPYKRVRYFAFNSKITSCYVCLNRWKI